MATRESAALMPREPGTNRFLPLPPFDTNVTEGKRAWIDCMARGLTWTQAAAETGTHRFVALRWREADPDFAQAWQAALRLQEAEITGTLYRRATDPNAGMAGNVAAFGWGKRHFPQEWSEKHLVITQAAGPLAELQAELLRAVLGRASAGAVSAGPDALLPPQS